MRSFRILRITLFTLLLFVPLTFIHAQDAGNAPQPETQTVLASLSQGERANISIDDLDNFQWSQRDFSDASLGCPQSGQNYAQVITPGYQFLLTYRGTVYDYRVAEGGDHVVLCDTRASAPTQPAPPTNPTPCESPYTVAYGDTLSGIAYRCGTRVAALMALNPDITDPALIYAGQTIVLPGSGDQNGRAVSIRPDSGPAGTTITVYASGFPSGAEVDIGLGAPESEYSVITTREIGSDGELRATVQIPPTYSTGDYVAVVALNGEETVSEPFTVTPGQVQPTATPTEPSDGGPFTQTQIYLVAIGDAGRSGMQIGCDDSLIPVTVQIQPTIAPLTAALNQLLSLHTRTYGQSGLYNALYQSDLRVNDVTIRNGEADIYLAGDVHSGGVCDTPRIEGQLRQTALQYYTVDSVNVYVNGERLADVD